MYTPMWPLFQTAKPGVSGMVPMVPLTEALRYIASAPMSGIPLVPYRIVMESVSSQPYPLIRPMQSAVRPPNHLERMTSS